jgi:hypothetical protein
VKGALVALLLAACVSPEEPPREPIAVPFAVSDLYSPDGFFGDGATKGHLAADKTCPDRAPGALGDCYTVSYRPADRNFAGIYWQFPHNNWGQAPGHVIAAGANRISFQVRGSRGNEEVAFGAGQPRNANPSMFPYYDRFMLAPAPMTMSTSWTRQELPLSNYGGPSGVIGAFLLSIDAKQIDRGDPDAQLVFYLDDLRWAP